MRFGAEAFGQEKTPHEKEAGLGLEQRAAFPVAGVVGRSGSVAGSAPPPLTPRPSPLQPY